MSMAFERRYSQLDASVNCTVRTLDGGMLEARYVQRDPSYFIVYLSSHSGCSHTCRFCHLTATNQRMMTPATPMEYLAQAGEVFDVYRQKVQDGMAPAPRVHFNFMARGEALSNPYLIHESQRLFDALRGMARAYGVEEVRFNVSSIYPVSTSASPNDGPVELTTILADPDSELYYSLYSLDNAFRKRWLPHAINPLIALRKIAEYQEATGRRTTLHWAFIKDQNDRLEDVVSIIETVLAFKLKVKFNLVRYNPYDARYGVESSEEVLQDRFALLAEAFQDSDSRIVPRVGYDVAASCGCFLTP